MRNYSTREQRDRRRDADIYDRHYRRNDDDYADERRQRESGRPNHPNYGREFYHEAPRLRDGYGYNQGRSSASNVGGRAYGQSYGQYFQGSDRREWSNQRDYQGNYDPYEYRREYDFDDERFDGDYDEYDHIERYADPDYPHDGYQGSGYTEGFGRRGGHRNERDWLHADEYRGGHAQRHRGFGKYGAR